MFTPTISSGIALKNHTTLIDWKSNWSCSDNLPVLITWQSRARGRGERSKRAAVPHLHPDVPGCGFGQIEAAAVGAMVPLFRWNALAWLALAAPTSGCRKVCAPMSGRRGVCRKSRSPGASARAPSPSNGQSACTRSAWSPAAFACLVLLLLDL